MMDLLFDVRWQALFVPKVAVAEIVLRGTFVYLTLFLLMRLVLKRQAGALGINDLLVVVLLADAAQNAMATNYTSITDGMILVGTIVFWSYALTWLSHRFSRFRHFIHPMPVQLVKEGKILDLNLKQELLTEEELMSQLRQKGVKDISLVQESYMENDGTISVILRESEHALQIPNP